MRPADPHAEYGTLCIPTGAIFLQLPKTKRRRLTGDSPCNSSVSAALEGVSDLRVIRLRSSLLVASGAALALLAITHQQGYAIKETNYGSRQIGIG